MTTQEICTAICLISHADFDERVAQNLIDAISGRIAGSSFKHQDHAINAVEYLDDAATLMECAADDIRAEAGAVHG